MTDRWKVQGSTISGRPFPTPATHELGAQRDRVEASLPAKAAGNGARVREGHTTDGVPSGRRTRRRSDARGGRGMNRCEVVLRAPAAGDGENDGVRAPGDRTARQSPGRARLCPRPRQLVSQRRGPGWRTVSSPTPILGQGRRSRTVGERLTLKGRRARPSHRNVGGHLRPAQRLSLGLLHGCCRPSRGGTSLPQDLRASTSSRSPQPKKGIKNGATAHAHRTMNPTGPKGAYNGVRFKTATQDATSLTIPHQLMDRPRGNTARWCHADA